MGSWYRLYCYLSNEKIENPYENCNRYEKPDGTIELDDLDRVDESGRNYQDIIMELCSEGEGKMYSSAELIIMFAKKLSDRSTDDMIEIFSLINGNNDEISWIEEGLVYLAALITKMKEKGSKYVWLIRYYG